MVSEWHGCSHLLLKSERVVARARVAGKTGLVLAVLFVKPGSEGCKALVKNLVPVVDLHCDYLPAHCLSYTSITVLASGSR